MCDNISDDTTYADLFREIASINYRNLVKIVRATFEKVTILFLWTHLKGTCYSGVTLFVIVNMQNKFHTESVGRFMISDVNVATCIVDGS